MQKFEINNNVFESIKHIDENGNEYWYARELQKILEYKEWRKFNDVITKSKIACENSNNNITCDFVYADKIVKAGATTKKIKDYKLSRYACYLIAQNGDSSIFCTTNKSYLKKTINL